jgi:hypothetical protein
MNISTPTPNSASNVDSKLNSKSPHKGIRMIHNTHSHTDRIATTSRQYRKVLQNIIKGNVIIDHTIHPTPKQLNIPLKLHQQRILHEMLEKEKKTYRIGNKINMFVLSDKVGSGKSIDILALLCEKPTLDDTHYLDMNTMNYKIPKIYKGFKGLQLSPTIIFKTNLIVIPHNIFNQWLSYITDFTTLSVYSIHTRKQIHNIVFQDIIDGKYNIILVKSTMYNDLMRHIYNTYTSTNKMIYQDSEYKDIYTIKTLSVQIETEIKKSLYNIQYNNYKNIKDKFIQYKNIVNNINIDAIITTMRGNNQTVSDIYQYTGPIFERVIFDEANSIKIPSCLQALGKVNWFITSSVEDLLYPWGRWEYNVNNDSRQINGIRGSGFIKDTFCCNSHKFLLSSIQDMYIKNNDIFVEKSFGLPDPIKHIIKCWTPPELLVLTGIATPEVISALNAGDSASAIRMTNCNVSNETDIIKSTLSFLHESLTKYNQLLEEKRLLKEDNEQQIRPNMTEEDRKEIIKKIKNINVSLKNFTTKKNDILFKITALKERVSNINEKTCPICLCDVTNPCLTDCCKNIYCMACYIQALKYSRNKCPHCRAKNRKISNVTLIHNELNTKKATISDLPKKEDELIRIITSKPNGRFLVFSEYNNTFNNIVSKINEHSIQYNKLSGSSGRITNIINDFKTNKINLLLLNAKNSGSGLNLQMTTDIIIYHKMSSALENQVIGRGQRLGRTEALHVHYLYYENEH